jgi:hypothetical protein
VFVEFHIQPHVASSHGLLSKLADLLDGLGSFLLEGAALSISTHEDHFRSRNPFLKILKGWGTQLDTQQHTETMLADSSCVYSISQ